MTPVLAASFPELTIVDGSKQFCDSLRNRFPSANVVESLFEHFQPSSQFDTIVLGHVLEHVDSTLHLLRAVRSWLNPGGIVCSAVPNARSIHRQAAVLMGLLPTEQSLNETDLHHGHRRVYDPESYRADFLVAGLKIHTFGGYWLKPLSNAQIEQTWTSDMLEAFMELGERYPDVAGEIYIIAGA
jgi:2-polyprenyl-3-methyl-5-hydroxy-6-metoxy-1,4-benzoquinol methylase